MFAKAKSIQFLLMEHLLVMDGRESDVQGPLV